MDKEGQLDTWEGRATCALGHLHAVAVPNRLVPTCAVIATIRFVGVGVILR